MIQKSKRRFSVWIDLMLVCAAATPGHGLNETRTNLYKQLSGTKGTGSLLYEVRVRSAIHCAILCLGCPDSDGCGFDGSSNTCRFFRGRSSQADSGSMFMYKLLDPYIYDCEDILDSGSSENGVYTIVVNQLGTRRKVTTFCELSQGEAWTVILKRVDDPVPFDTYEWAEYKAGFGNKDGAYYLGNDNIHDLTMSGGYNYTLRVELTADDGTSLYADYGMFAVEGENDKYKLILGPYLDDSTLGDSFSRSNGIMFSTSDQDNDPLSSVACASINAGGWWYWGCTKCKLTSEYGPGHDLFHSITWDSWPTSYTYFMYVAMKLRRN